MFCFSAKKVFGLAFVCVVILTASVYAEDSKALRGEPLRPLVMPVGLDAKKIDLGRKLFLDPILSADNTVSCASCHGLASGGTDHQSQSTGIHQAVGAVKAPTVYNSGLNFVQFWDGRAATLEEQAGGPITNPVEMGATWTDVLTKLKSDATYSREFYAAFGSPPTQASVQEAIATFERTLVTVDSPFDRFLKGDTNAINDLERQGYALFKSYGCASCHQGVNVGGNMFQKFGFMGNLFIDRGKVRPADWGRYNVTHRESDRFVFKVPSLRLAAINSPYFHDGSVASLQEAIHIMGRYQLGREIPDKDVDAIAAFLGSLVGTMETP